MNTSNLLIPYTGSMLVKKDGYIVRVHKHIDSITCNKIYFKVDNEFTFTELISPDDFYTLRTGRIHGANALPETTLFTKEQLHLAIMQAEIFLDASTTYTTDQAEEAMLKDLIISTTKEIREETVVPVKKIIDKRTPKKTPRKKDILRTFSELVRK